LTLRAVLVFQSDAPPPYCIRDINVPCSTAMRAGLYLSDRGCQGVPTQAADVLRT